MVDPDSRWIGWRLTKQGPNRRAFCHAVFANPFKTLTGMVQTNESPDWRGFQGIP